MSILNGGVVECTLPYLDSTPDQTFSIIESGTDCFSRYIAELLSGGTPRRPDIGDLQGTPFQRKVWSGLLTIPRGETRSYGELARALGCERAYRAVANACGRNPLPLFVPCHRVVGANGDLGGFSSGLPWKRLLLEKEGARPI